MYLLMDSVLTCEQRQNLLQLICCANDEFNVSANLYIETHKLLTHGYIAASCGLGEKPAHVYIPHFEQHDQMDVTAVIA